MTPPPAKRKTYRLGFEVALLAAVLAHALFFFCLQSKPTELKPKVNRHQLLPDCILLSEKGHGGNWEEEVHAWVDIADPTLLTLSNEEHGFSAARHQKREHPYTPPLPFSPNDSLQAENAFKRINLAPKPSDFSADLSSHWTVPPPPSPESSESNTIPKKLFWRTPDGTVLDSLPAPDIAGMIPTITIDELTGPTRVQISQTVRTLRIRLRQSCGIISLDSLAVDHLRKNIQTLQARQSETVSAIGPILEIDWRLPLLNKGN